MSSPDIIAFCNQKGGVGKTTCALNVAVGLTQLEKKVLVIDFDPQAHLTYSLGLDAHDLKKTISAVMEGATPLAEAVIETGGMQVLPANLDLSSLEAKMSDLPKKETVLKSKLSSVENVDFVIIDCPPSSGLLTVNALVACREVMIPLQMEFLALKGMSRLLTLIESVKKKHKQNTPSYRVIATRFDGRKRLNNAIMDKVRERFGENVFQTVIRENIAVAEAPSFGQSIFAYAPRSHGASDYLELCREIVGKKPPL
ncbi:MAG: ParA family protein [Syntrophaceae bacterium]|jgi:chromosome partitioning protein|nr:ParA family protein [Syntrophaceae bacterium]HOC59862.1 ParA family protein [Smithellaceae bacterium]HQM45639.1 ParA family protein [Smithellaceae bacterium]